MAKHVEAMVGFMDKGAEVFDYGNSIRDEARKGGYDRAFAFPGFVPGLHPPAVLRGQGPVPLGGALRRPEGHRRHRPRDPRAVPRQRAPAALDPDGAGARRLPGPARAHLLARLRRARQGRPRVQRAGRERRGQRPDRHRPRPPRLRLGRLALPRDRGHGSTAPTRSPTGRCSTPWSTSPPGASWVSIHHGGGVGIGRSIHAGQVRVADGTDARRAEARPRAHQRPGHGRHPPRRRRLRPRGRGRRRARRAHPDAWTTTA